MITIIKPYPSHTYKSCVSLYRPDNMDQIFLKNAATAIMIIIKPFFSPSKKTPSLANSPALPAA